MKTGCYLPGLVSSNCCDVQTDTSLKQTPSLAVPQVQGVSRLTVLQSLLSSLQEGADHTSTSSG